MSTMSKVATVFALIHDLSREELQEVMLHGMARLCRHPLGTSITPSSTVLEALPGAPGAPSKAQPTKKLSKKAMKALQESGASAADAIASAAEPKSKKILSPEHLAALKAGREKKAAEKAAAASGVAPAAEEAIEQTTEQITA